MKKYIIGKIYDKIFIPALVGGMAVLGYIIYNQGRADTVHQIYRNGWAVIDANGDNLEFEKH